MIKTDTGWSHPFLAEFIKGNLATEPALSPDGNILVFSSNKDKSWTNDYNLWMVKKEDGDWSAPESILDMEGYYIFEFHPSITQDSILYFCWWKYDSQYGNIYFSKPCSGYNGHV